VRFCPSFLRPLLGAWGRDDLPLSQVVVVPMRWPRNDGNNFLTTHLQAPLVEYATMQILRTPLVLKL